MRIRLAEEALAAVVIAYLAVCAAFCPFVIFSGAPLLAGKWNCTQYQQEAKREICTQWSREPGK